MTRDRDAELIAAALAARARAYAPYSGYQVGCALTVRGADTIYAGANIENASFGLTTCAERTAVLQAVFAGHRELEVVVVATESSPPAAPCGLCRQTLNEFSSDPDALRILLVNDRGERREVSLGDIFPHGFRGESLPGQAAAKPAEPAE